MSIITKNALVLRDLDLLAPMAAAGLVHVNISITSLNPDLARAMEPRASALAARLRHGTRALGSRRAGASSDGANHSGPDRQRDPRHPRGREGGWCRSAGYTLLRLPLAVARSSWNGWNATSRTG